MSAKVAQPRKRSRHVIKEKFSGSKKPFKLKTRSSHGYEKTRAAWKRIAKRRSRRETL